MANDLTPEDVIGFYGTADFLGWYTPAFRVRQLKKIFRDKRTTAAERLATLKYLDAHVGDIPAKGPDSAPLTIHAYLGIPPAENDVEANLGEKPAD